MVFLFLKLCCVSTYIRLYLKRSKGEGSHTGEDRLKSFQVSISLPEAPELSLEEVRGLLEELRTVSSSQRFQKDTAGCHFVHRLYRLYTTTYSTAYVCFVFIEVICVGLGIATEVLLKGNLLEWESMQKPDFGIPWCQIIAQRGSIGLWLS